MRRAAAILVLLLTVPLLLALRYDGMAGSVLSVLHIRTTDSCIAGYTRSVSVPNFCQKDTYAVTIWTDAVACTATAPVDTLPVTANRAELGVAWRVYANNAVASRNNEIRFYEDASCTANDTGYSRIDLREFVAVAAGTVIGVTHDHFNVALVNEAGVMKMRTTETNAGGNGNGDLHQISIIGYYD
jgi:hypothetical protein